MSASRLLGLQGPQQTPAAKYLIVKAYVIQKHTWVIHIKTQEVKKKLNFPSDDCCEKSSKLLTKFWLTTLAYQSVERFCLDRKPNLHNFFHGDTNNLTNNLLSQRFLYQSIDKNGE